MSHGYKARPTVALYDQSLSSFIAMAADDFKMLVSYARLFSDFCGVFEPIPHLILFFFCKHTEFYHLSHPEVTQWI
jgi:hypothetical protein